MKFLKYLFSVILLCLILAAGGVIVYNGGIPANIPETVRACYEKVRSEISVALYENDDDYTFIRTTPILQNPQFPTGCESVALTMALESLGYDLSKTEIVDQYLIYDDQNYAAGFVGDPRSTNGGGIFPPGLTNTANNYLQAQGSGYSAYNISGTAFTDLFSYVDQGNSVLLWITYNYENPVFNGNSVYYDGQEYLWYQKEHCVMLGGYNLTDNTVLLYDPMNGLYKVPIDTVESLYNQIGNFAVAIY